MDRVKNQNLYYFINSFSYIMLAYIMIFILSRLFMGTAGLFFEIPSRIYRHGLVFVAQEDVWWYDSVVTVFFSRVFSYLVLGLIMHIIYLKSSVYKGYLKLFFMWASFIAFTFLLGEIFLGNILKEGVYFALSWLYVSDIFRLIMMVVLVLIYLLMGIMFSKSFTYSANIYFGYFNEVRLKEFFLYQLLFPYLAAMVVVSLMMIPEFPVITLVSLYLGVIMIFIALYHSGKHAQYMKDEEEPMPVFLDHKAFLAAVFLIIFYVVGLSNGIALS